MSKKKQNKDQEIDSVYVLKLVLYLILGAQWVRVSKGNMEMPIPYGFVIGLLFAAHDHFQIDRKIEYALLLISMFVGFWLPIGYEIILK